MHVSNLILYFTLHRRLQAGETNRYRRTKSIAGDLNEQTALAAASVRARFLFRTSCIICRGKKNERRTLCKIKHQ